MSTLALEMKNIQWKHKDQWQKWALSLSLVFSVFTFSGYLNQSSSGPAQTAQIELLISKDKRPSQRVFSFKQYLQGSYAEASLFGPSENWTYSLFAYNSLTDLKFDRLSRLVRVSQYTPRFLQAKTIATGQEEDGVAALLG